MVKAVLNGTVLADSKDTIVVENNHYFPPSTVSHLTKDSKTTTVCGWKGTAQYFNVNVDGNVVKDVAWYYPEPKEAAANIRDYVAFYKNKVEIQT